ncbi:hypothetical protein LAZ67_5000948 [Cordylochernes scorpioides]|uniref:TIR domain-containing protein n=1 Tax=Cordylochernes scorpioides TaxID=51811 RepID=A0ABY6KI80_9ARAC|nr:hypothetical protein LAZ67_5000948 [Cordylochernes scorpioides]
MIIENDVFPGLLVWVTDAYPTTPNPGFTCGWSQKVTETMAYWAQGCSKNGDTSLGFTYETWYMPTPALTLKCWGANPYRKNMLQYYDMAQFETFMFRSCSLPPMPFSDMLTNLRVRTLIFSSKTATIINPDIFQNLPYLTFLDLSNNLLTTLTSNFFDSLTNVSSVSLGFNSLTFLPEDVFFKLNLFHIDLGDNKLESLPEKIFKGQFGIKNMLIPRNKLTVLPEHIFDDQKAVRYLDLTQNNLLSLSPGAFYGLLDVYKIIVRGNRLSEISGEWFKNTSKLYIFDMSDNPIVNNIPEHLFKGLGYLSDLGLSKCKFTEIPDNLFAPVHNVSYLDLSSNNIFKLTVNTFKFNQRITTLKLKNNNIQIIPDGAFSNQTYLEYLDLNDNKISKITKGMFKSLSRLLSLSISDNDIDSIEEHSFDELVSINRIDLSNNRLLFLPKDIFRRINMYTLNLSGNKLTSTEYIFQNFRYGEINLSHNKLKYLDIPKYENSALNLDVSHNEIEHVNISQISGSTYGGKINLLNNPLNCDCQIFKFYEFYKTNKNIFEQENGEYLTCTNPPNLKDIELHVVANNKFICDVEENCPEECKCYTREVDKTTFMDCSNSHLETIPTRVVRNVSILLMNNNKISSISGLSKPDWKHLREMSFENNQIISDNWELPPSLEYINLKNNKLSWLSPNIFNYSASYGDFKIKLASNPWKCNCNLTSMRYWLISLKGKVQDPENIICEDPIIEKGKYVYPRIDEIPLNILCPPNTKVADYFIVIAIIIPASILLIVLIILIFYYKNKQIVLAYLYIHAYKLFRCLYNEEEMDEDKKYDAFICYSHEDRDVAVELSAELESKAPFYTLCIHERDWTPGNLISANVIQSVQESRRTVMILSEVFLNSPWFAMEFQTAYQQMMEEKKDRMIIVIKGQLPDKSTLDSELQFLLQTKTYLEWNERFFWEKMRYALPHKKKKDAKILIQSPIQVNQKL